MTDTPTEMTERSAARAAILDALVAYRDAGVVDPTIPVYADVDGDGIPDVYGLDAFGRLELRSGVDVADTVAVTAAEDDR